MFKGGKGFIMTDSIVHISSSPDWVHNIFLR